MENTVGAFGSALDVQNQSQTSTFGCQPKGLFKELFKSGSRTVGTFVGTLPQNWSQFCTILRFRVFRHLLVTAKLRATYLTR